MRMDLDPTNRKVDDPMIPTRTATSAAVLLAAASMLPAAATAQAAGPWQYGLSLYGWLPTISGTTVFPPPATGGSDVALDADAILDALKFTFMGTLEVHNGAWGGFTDFVYDITGPLVAPFEGIFGAPDVETGVFDPASLVAIVVYSLIAWVIAKVLDISLGETRTGVRSRSRSVDTRMR